MTRAASPPPFLYHGTTERLLDRILAEGIRPRGGHGKSNWKTTVESNPECVYLTDAYPLFFAGNCVRRGERLAVLQLETDRLDDGRLVPDEDVLEQSGRGLDGLPGAMRKRTRSYRARLPEFLFTDAWRTSLRGMGTCGYMGVIAPDRIARVALVDPKLAPTLTLAATDAMICLSNYRFCGPKYRNLTSLLFGLPGEPDPLEPDVDERLLDNPDCPPFVRQVADYRRAFAARLDKELGQAVELRDLARKAAA